MTHLDSYLGITRNGGFWISVHESRFVYKRHKKSGYNKIQIINFILIDVTGVTSCFIQLRSTFVIRLETKFEIVVMTLDASKRLLKSKNLEFLNKNHRDV